MCDHLEFNCVDIVEAESAKDFLELLNPTNDSWGKELKCPWVFRGQGKAKWGLLPSAWRPVGRRLLSDLMVNIRPIAQKKYEGTATLENENAIEALTITAAVFEITHQFCELANELGYLVPGQKEVSGAIDFIKDSDWPNHWHRARYKPSPAFGLAQHHGLPTHLLDWTRNPYIAAFFAAESYQLEWLSDLKDDIKAGEILKPAEEFAVWAINLEHIATGETDSNSLVRFTCPRAQHGFLHAQDAFFLWHTRGDGYYKHNGRWPDFLDVIEKGYTQGQKPVKKVVLSGGADEVLERLRRFRISRSHLMPTYDNVAKEVLSLGLRLTFEIDRLAHGRRR